MCLGIPARVCRVDGADGPLPQAEVEVAGTMRTVCAAYVPEVTVGDYVLVQNGFAMTVVDEQSAQESLVAIEEYQLLNKAGG